MPDKETIKRARRDKQEGKAPSTQAGEFVREEVEHVREGKHGARSAKQAIAIGLSKARRAGVHLPPNPNDKSPAKKSSRKAPARKRSSETSAKRSRAATKALKKEPRSGASHTALSRQARKTAAKRGSANRHKAAVKAAATRRRNKG